MMIYVESCIVAVVEMNGVKLEGHILNTETNCAMLPAFPLDEELLT